MARLTISNLDKRFGAFDILKDVNLEIPSGEFVVFVGPSGCGKSTLLRCISGLEAVSGGRLSIDGVDVTKVPPSQRGIAMVFQSYALYPHMSVFDNMAYALKIQSSAKSKSKPRCATPPASCNLISCSIGCLASSRVGSGSA